METKTVMKKLGYEYSSEISYETDNFGVATCEKYTVDWNLPDPESMPSVIRVLRFEENGEWFVRVHVCDDEQTVERSETISNEDDLYNESLQMIKHYIKTYNDW